MTVKADWVDKDTPGKSSADWTYDSVAANAIAAQCNGHISAIAARAPTVATIAALRNTSGGYAHVAGYYAAGDGGGGVFRWDSSDTTSTDNKGTIITPSGGLSATGRWKRVYEGDVNARWFGVNPSQADNTAALQAAVDWVSSLGGTVFIPSGRYVFLFDQGTSGLSTITIADNDVLIRGEGRGTWLVVDDHAYPNQLDYFVTFSQTGRGQGGGLRDIAFDGQSMLKWCVYLGCWRNAEFMNVSAMDVHSGILDAESNNTTLYGENIRVEKLDYVASDGTCVTQYGIRFRAGHDTDTYTWSECTITDAVFVCCWDTGLVLDGVQRFRVRNVASAWNESSTDTIDNTAKAGALHAVWVANTVDKPTAGSAGGHVIDCVYLESLYGTETPDVNVAVLVSATDGVEQSNRYSRISNVTANGTSTGKIRFYDENELGYVNNNVYATPGVASITTSATPAINVNEVDRVHITALAAAVTSMTDNLSGVPVDGQKLMVRIKDDGTPRAITWGASFVSSGVATLLATTVTSMTHLVGFVYDAAAAVWVCVACDTDGY